MKKQEALKDIWDDIVGLIIVGLAIFAFNSDAASNRTIKTEVITTDKSNQDIIITPTGTGDVVLKTYTGFLNWATGTPTEITSVDSTEFQYLDGVTSAIQAQIDGKEPTITTLPVSKGGTNSSTALSDNFVMISSGGAIVESATTTTTLGYLDATSSVQTQLNAKLESVDLTSDVGATILPIANGGTGSATQNFVDLTTAQSIAGVKTFSVDSLWSGTGQIDIPAGTTLQRSGSPNNGMFRYNTDNNQFEGYSAGAWGEIGGGGDGINYIANPDFDANINNWTGDTNLVISQETVAPLRDAGSLKIAKGAIDASTQEVYADTFNVETADLAKKLIGSFDYDFSDTDYADGDARIEVEYDLGGTPKTIRVNGEDINGGKGTHYFQFQTDSTITDYRVKIVWQATTTVAVDAFVDRVKVAPQIINHGAIVTDWEAESCSGSWTTNTTITCMIRRVGDSLEVQYSVVLTGAPDAVALTLNPITGKAVDSTKVALRNQGTAEFVESGIREYIGGLYWNGTTFSAIHTESTGSGNISNTAPFTWGSGDVYSATVIYPVQGWGGNTKMSSDFTAKDQYANYRYNTTWTANNVAFTEQTLDTDNTISGSDNNIGLSSGKVLINETARYTACVFIRTTAVVTATDIQQYVYIDRGGSITRKLINRKGYSAEGISLNGCTTLDLIKGDLVTQSVYQNSGAGITMGINSYLSLIKIAYPQTQLENELVAASYETNSGQTVTNTNTIDFEDLIHDTHNAVTTGAGWVFTVPVSGKYHVSTGTRATSTSVAANQLYNTYFYINAVESGRTSTDYAYGATNRSFSTNGSKDFDLVAGDTISIRWGNTITSATLETTGHRNFITIHRIK